MKKKIKDLTLEECTHFCFRRECEECPLRYRNDTCRLLELKNIRERENAHFDLEREIEIDESDND